MFMLSYARMISPKLDVPLHLIEVVAAVVIATFTVVGILQPPGSRIPNWAWIIPGVAAVVVFVVGANLLYRAWHPVAFIKSYVEPPTNPLPDFDPKVRLEFRNTSASCLDIETFQWSAGKRGLTTRHNSPRAAWQTYENEKWQPSPNGLARIHVRPGQEFRTWVVFDPALSRTDLEKRRLASSLGKLGIQANRAILRFKT
jgi:hypothetical protein